jgi:hypothetical protein
MKTTFFLIISLLLVFACDKKPDDPVIPNEEEVITTLVYTLTPKLGGPSVTLRFRDLDGDGGNAPEIMSEALDSNMTYFGKLVLLNEQEVPADDITIEVKNEGEDHQFFYETNVQGVAINYSDKDNSGAPIGIDTELTTGSAGKGTLKIILRHKLNKSASGVSEGKILNASGETDIEVQFTIEVK